MTQQDRAQFFTVNIRDGCRVQCIASLLLSSYFNPNLCAVKPGYNYCTPLRLFSMLEGQIGRQKQVKRAN